MEICTLRDPKIVQRIERIDTSLIVRLVFISGLCAAGLIVAGEPTNSPVTAENTVRDGRPAILIESCET